jgi:hypothetical protein
VSNRIKTVPSLVLAALLASVVSTDIACVAARAADDCLNEPKHQTPPGGHWYYRIERPSQRKCWYLADEGQHVSQSGSPRPLASSSPPPLPQQSAAAVKPSLADARAELPIATTPAEPPQWFSPTAMSNPEKFAEVAGDARPSEALSPPSARDPESETRVIDGQAGTQSQTELLPAATDREPVAEPSVEETTAGPLRVGLALLLIVLGMSIIGGCLIFGLSAAVPAGRRNVFSSR